MWHEKKVRTILFDDSHLGISASLCVHFSGSSVFRQAAHTSEICMLAKSGRPSESERLNILESEKRESGA